MSQADANNALQSKISEMKSGTSFGGSRSAGRTHFDIDEADIAALRELQAAAHDHIAEMRQDPSNDQQLLADAEGELAVVENALEEADGDGAAA